MMRLKSEDAHVLIVNVVRADGFEHFVDIGTGDGQFCFRSSSA